MLSLSKLQRLHDIKLVVQSGEQREMEMDDNTLSSFGVDARYFRLKRSATFHREHSQLRPLRQHKVMRSLNEQMVSISTDCGHHRGSVRRDSRFVHCRHLQNGGQFTVIRLWRSDKVLMFQLESECTFQCHNGTRCSRSHSKFRRHSDPLLAPKWHVPPR